MEEKLKYEFEGHIPASAVALYLEMLAAALRKGRGHIQAPGAVFDYAVADEVDFEVEIKVDSDDNEGKVEIEYKWSLGRRPMVEPNPTLRITTPDPD